MKAMRRRNFIALAGLALPASLRELLPDHHLVSSKPLMVDFDIASLHGRYTTTEDFYVRNHRDIPSDAEAPSLRIEGEVARPLDLTPDRLATFKSRKLGAVLECAGNPVATVGKVSNGTWEGWSLGELLSMARPSGAGVYLNFFGRDGYGRSVPIARAYEAAMVATHLNGQPLSRRHGAPWRALFPGWYGMDAVKWLERIVVSESPLPTDDTAYLQVIQQPLGGIQMQPLPRVQVKSLILSPESGAVVRLGKVETRGLAWSGQGPISQVEVSADGGMSWQLAALAPSSAYEWVTWRLALELNRVGAYELVCRATDGRGSKQPAERDPQRLDGYANAWYHRVSCVVV